MIHFSKRQGESTFVFVKYMNSVSIEEEYLHTVLYIMLGIYNYNIIKTCSINIIFNSYTDNVFI